MVRMSKFVKLLDVVRNELIKFVAYHLGIQYPFKACCGAGGEYNVVPDVGCGSSGYVNGTFVISERCSDPTLYLMWDPIHPTESFARYVAEGVTSGSHLRPEFNIKGECIMSM